MPSLNPLVPSFTFARSNPHSNSDSPSSSLINSTSSVSTNKSGSSPTSTTPSSNWTNTASTTTSTSTSERASSTQSDHSVSDFANGKDRHHHHQLADSNSAAMSMSTSTSTSTSTSMSTSPNTSQGSLTDFARSRGWVSSFNSAPAPTPTAAPALAAIKPGVLVVDTSRPPLRTRSPSAPNLSQPKTNYPGTGTGKGTGTGTGTGTSHWDSVSTQRGIKGLSLAPNHNHTRVTGTFDPFGETTSQSSDSSSTSPLAPSPLSEDNAVRAKRTSAQVRWSDQVDVYDVHEARVKLESKSEPALRWIGQGRNVYIHEVPSDLTTDKLIETASYYGVVKTARIGNGLSNVSSHLTRVSSKTFEAAEQALAFMDALRKQGMGCDHAKEDWQTEYKALEDPFCSNLYIVGFPPTLNQEEMEDFLNQFGTVQGSKPLTDADGNRRGPVLARMASRAQADLIIREFNGKLWPGASERMQVRIADNEQQKEHKRQQRTGLVSGARSSESLHRGTSKESMRSILSSDTGTEARNKLRQLRETRNAFIAEIAKIDIELANLSTTSGYPPLTPQSSVSSIFSQQPTVSSASSILFSPQPMAYHHRHTSSGLSDFAGTPGSSSTTGFSSPSYHANPPTSTSTAYIRGAPYTPTRQASFSSGSVHLHARNDAMDLSKGGLYHPRSSPELGRKRESPAQQRDDTFARCLWPQ